MGAPLQIAIFFVGDGPCTVPGICISTHISSKFRDGLSQTYHEVIPNSRINSVLLRSRGVPGSFRQCQRNPHHVGFAEAVSQVVGSPLLSHRTCRTRRIP
jgi:hypothetical protein